jgi:hypothetical protein
MAMKRTSSKTKFEMPKFRKGKKVKTPNGEGIITDVKHDRMIGYLYFVDNMYYHQEELE